MYGSRKCFYLKQNEEADCSFYLESVLHQCRIRIRLCHCQVNAYVTLFNCQDCTCRVKSLCGGGGIQFGFLPSGTYILTVCRNKRTYRFLIRIPPGGNVNVFLCCCTGQCHWDSNSVPLLCDSKATQPDRQSKFMRVCRFLFLYKLFK